MLVTFTSKAFVNITMLGDVAQCLLKIMGYSEKASGMIKSEDIPAVTLLLKKAIEQEKTQPFDQTIDNEEQPVGLKQRAFPLIEMLNAAEKEKCDVMWKTI